MFEKVVEVEWPIVKQAPFAFIAAVIVGVTIASAFWIWFYNDRLDVLKQNIIRYRITAGLDKATARTNMTELTNAELKRKALSLTERIREILSVHERHMKRIADDQKKGTNQDQWPQLFKDKNKRAWKQFETIRVDALMVNDELRARISPRIKEKIITAAPRFSSADDPNAELSIHRFMLEPFAVSHAQTLAYELEELAKLHFDQLQACIC